jgi:transcriptional regulator with XRE-family HTH domain
MPRRLYLRRRRIELGLYQKDVAARLGVTTSTIWNWEHGWTIRKKFIPRIVVFLGYNPDQSHTIPELNSKPINSNYESIKRNPSPIQQNGK